MGVQTHMVLPSGEWVYNIWHSGDRFRIPLIFR